MLHLISKLSLGINTVKEKHNNSFKIAGLTALLGRAKDARRLTGRYV